MAQACELWLCMHDLLLSIDWASSLMVAAEEAAVQHASSLSGLKLLSQGSEIVDGLEAEPALNPDHEPSTMPRQLCVA